MAESSTAEVPATESHAFQAETKALLNLVINSLYTHKEVFLRELISNASDALDKARLRSLTEHDLLGDDTDLGITIVPDAAAKTLTITDNGVGMTHDELKANLGTIAKSGSAEFVKHLTGEPGQDANLIGQFGVGFYSSFLVADRVEVTSRGAGHDEAWTWRSTGEGEFTLEAATREKRGTDITLHIREEQLEFLDSWRLQQLVKKYSDFVGHPISLVRETTEGEGEEQTTSKTTEVVNQGKALWTRSKSDLTDEQYEEFYKHVTHDWESPLARTHFTIEGRQLFTGLLFTPKRAPFDLFMREAKSGVRLYVKRVFVMDDCDALLPEYLRFVKGVIDSDDLPLNVSREVLQRDELVNSIKKQVTKKSLAMLEELAEEKPEDYAVFWTNFGRVLKEGFALDQDNKEKLAKLVRYHSTTSGDEPTSLAGYVERMKEGQELIYYISGAGMDRDALAKSPHLEGLKAKGYEVLFFTDPVDEWVGMHLPEFEGKKIVSAMKGELDLDGEKDEAKDKERDEKFGSLTSTMKSVLGDRVGDVRLTDRLTDSAVCLVSGANDAGANLERIMKAAGQDAAAFGAMGGSKRILELNAKHPVIENLNSLVGNADYAERLKDWTELLHDQALLTEGSPIADPAGFAIRMNTLLVEVSKTSE